MTWREMGMAAPMAAGHAIPRIELNDQAVAATKLGGAPFLRG